MDKLGSFSLKMEQGILSILVTFCLLSLSQSCKTLTGKNFDLWFKDKSNFLKSVHMLST